MIFIPNIMHLWIPSLIIQPISENNKKYHSYVTFPTFLLHLAAFIIQIACSAYKSNTYRVIFKDTKKYRNYL